MHFLANQQKRGRRLERTLEERAPHSIGRGVFPLVSTCGCECSEGHADDFNPLLERYAHGSMLVSMLVNYSPLITVRQSTSAARRPGDHARL